MASSGRLHSSILSKLVAGLLEPEQVILLLLDCLREVTPIVVDRGQLSGSDGETSRGTRTSL